MVVEVSADLMSDGSCSNCSSHKVPYCLYLLRYIWDGMDTECDDIHQLVLPRYISVLINVTFPYDFSDHVDCCMFPF